MPELRNRSRELCLLLLIHVKILYISTKAPWHPLQPQSFCRNLLPAACAWHSLAQGQGPVPTAPASDSLDTALGLHLGQSPQTEGHGTTAHTHSTWWEEMTCEEGWVSRSHGKASCLSWQIPQELPVLLYTHQQSFPSQVRGRGEGALVTQLMTLSFSVEKLHEDTIKDTLSMYLIIFVRQNVIIMGKCG